jgi:hypothetical protein
VNKGKEKGRDFYYASARSTTFPCVLQEEATSRACARYY